MQLPPAPKKEEKKNTLAVLRGLLQDAVVDDDAGVLVLREGFVESDWEG